MRTYRRLLEESAGVGAADLRRHGRVVGGAVAARHPDLVEELEGIAMGASERLDELLAINARTELLGGAGPAAAASGECTVVGRLEGGRAVLAQNWDWHPDLAASRVAWTVEPPGGTPFTTVTEAGILAKLGVSRAGVACGLNFLTSSADGGVGGVPIHVLLRVVLDRCATVLEALSVLMAAPVTASSCITLATAEPDGPALLAVELSPGGASVVFPDADGVLVHANHFAAAPATGRDTQPADRPSTLLREWHARRELGGGGPVEAVLASHFPAPEGICRHASEEDPWPERRATLLSVVLDPAGPSLRLADGPPCQAAYAEVQLPWAGAPARLA